MIVALREVMMTLTRAQLLVMMAQTRTHGMNVMLSQTQSMCLMRVPAMADQRGVLVASNTLGKMSIFLSTCFFVPQYLDAFNILFM